MRLLDKRPPFALMVATGAACTVVILVFARLCYGLVLPAMREGLGLSYVQAANLSTATALGYLLFVMVAGVFAARYGGKQAVLIGLLLVTGGFIGLTQARDYTTLLVLMVLLGTGTAFGYTPLISLLSNSFPKRRGAVIGFTNSGVGLGMLMAGALVPTLTGQNHLDGWRQVWQYFAYGGVAVAVLAILVLRNPPSSTAKPDIAPANPLPATSPPQISVFRNPHVCTVGLIYGVLGLTYIIQATFMYGYALETGVPVQTAGHLVSAMGILSIFAGPSWGWLCDRLGHATGLALSMTLALVATIPPVLWPVTSAFAFHFVVLGMSVSGMFTSVLAASTATVRPQQAAIAVSFVTLFYAIGQLIGPAIAGVLIEWSGFRLTFACSCGVMVIGLWLCLRTRRYLIPAGTLNSCPASRTP